MTFHSFALRSSPVFIAIALPLAIVSCASDDAPSNQTGGMGNAAGTGGSAMGGSSGSSAGTMAKGGSSGTTSNGGSGTGGSSAGQGGTGGTAGSSAGKSGAGAAGKGTAGGGGQAGGAGSGAGGAAAAGSGGMGGASGGMGGASGGMAGTQGSGGSGGGGTFTLTSPTHKDGAHFDAKYTCAAMNGTFGAGVNPELDWTGVPAGTKSFVMTFIDTTIGEDMSMGQHWAIWNVPWDGTKVTMFPEGLGQTLSGDLASAKQSGKFLTPCAQSLKNNMDDEYEFRLYALSTETFSVTGTSVANVVTALKSAESMILGKAVLKGHAGLKGQ
jgi:phosphatidylethanolamine-binding protein (PEBP) family uncharacterized protein